MNSVTLVNRNGDIVSLVPSVIEGVIAAGWAADVDFDCGLAYILPKDDGTLAVKDINGSIDTITVVAGQFTPAMYAGVVLAGSDTIAFSYYS